MMRQPPSDRPVWPDPDQRPATRAPRQPRPYSAPRQPQYPPQPYRARNYAQQPYPPRQSMQRPPQRPARAPGGAPRVRDTGSHAIWFVMLVMLVLFGGIGFFALHLRGSGTTTPISLPGGILSSDPLSPQLSSYVAAQNGDMGVEVYDVTHDKTYAANADQVYVLASSAKVYLMLADFDRIEGAGATPNDNDQQLLTAMIEHSDNDSAQTIYEQIGYDKGMQAYLKKIGITDYVPCPDGWGCAKASSADMVHALTQLQKGKIVNSGDRTLALQLMNTIESDQQMGVGETAPSGATFYMKDGWLNYPDPAKWNLNSSGIVVDGHETYVISVYAQNQPGEDWTNVDHVCNLVAQTLA